MMRAFNRRIQIGERRIIDSLCCCNSDWQRVVAEINLGAVFVSQAVTHEVTPSAEVAGESQGGDELFAGVSFEASAVGNARVGAEDHESLRVTHEESDAQIMQPDVAARAKSQHLAAARAQHINTLARFVEQLN